MDRLVEVFSALADPTRLRIVMLLREMELSVGELAQVLGQSQPRVSRHAKILCEAGLAERRREGSWVFLTPARTELAGALDGLLTATLADTEHWRRADIARLAAVRADRAAAAERYFAGHAAEWDAIRALHVGDQAVEARMAQLLGERLGTLVDLGTGTGRMIELFGEQAERAIGLDRSPEMLRLARVKLDGRERFQLRQGDITALPLPDRTADTVIIHQVLHYLPSPEAAIGEAARVLAPGGRLLIVDFAAHEREELRASAAHARLGFSDEQIGAWLNEAGLSLDQVDELAGDPLTVKLWLARRAPQLKVIAA